MSLVNDVLNQEAAIKEAILQAIIDKSGILNVFDTVVMESHPNLRTDIVYKERELLARITILPGFGSFIKVQSQYQYIIDAVQNLEGV